MVVAFLRWEGGGLKSGRDAGLGSVVVELGLSLESI